MSREVDVVVVGLGPGGEAVATQLARAGLDVVGVDHHLVGGECPYYGCIPSKMMIRAADLLAEGRRIPGMSGTSSVSADWSVVATRISDEATDDWNDQVAVDRLVGNGVTFVRGTGRLAGTRTVEVGDETFAARRGVVLNTGTTPAVPPIPGLADTPYWTNRDAVQLKELPGSLLVIGGGAIGAELSQAFSRFGVSVTVIEVADRILALEEPESSALVTEVFGARGHSGAVGRRDLVGVVRRRGASRSSWPTARPWSATNSSWPPAVATTSADIGLDTVGLDPASKVLDTDDQMRAGDGLWAIGDITGRGAFTHLSMYQATIAAGSVLDREDAPRAAYHAVPRVTFTDPEVGSVGMTEKQARDAGLAVRVGLSDLPSSSRGWIHKAGNDGSDQAGRGCGPWCAGRRNDRGAERRRDLVGARGRRARGGADVVTALDDLRLPDVPPRS